MDKTKNDLISVLRKLQDKIILDNVKIKYINGKEDLILKGVLFDNEHTCYHSYEKIEDIVTSLMVSANNYGIFIGNEFIGIISTFYKDYKDLTCFEISVNIKKEYRNKKIGTHSLNYVIKDIFKNTNIKSIHLSIRESNIKSRKMAINCGFNEYEGCETDKVITDINGKTVNQIQYLLKKNI